MVDFPSAVALPPTSAYAPPKVDFSWLANLPDDYFRGLFNRQQQQLNQQKIEQGQQQLDYDKRMQQPIDTTDPGAVEAEMLRRGGGSYVSALLPFLIQAQQRRDAQQFVPPGVDVGQPASPAALASAKAPALSQGGDPGTGTVIDLVTDRLGTDNAKVGLVATNMAKMLKVDPNAVLTADQQTQINKWLDAYAGRNGLGASPSNGAVRPQASVSPGLDTGSLAAPSAAPARARVDQGFSAYPPSAGAVTPAPQRGGVMPPAPIGATRQVQMSPPPPPQSGPQPSVQAPPTGPIAPRVPLPVDPRTHQAFTDPMQAIMWLKQRAAQAATNPQAKAYADYYNDYAGMIEASIKPMMMHPGEVAFDPATGRQMAAVPPNSLLGRNSPEVISGIVDGIVNGTQPPTLTGLYGASGPVRAELDQRGFNLAQAQVEWQRAQRQISALNGPQMTRFVGLASSVDKTIDEVRSLAEEMQLSGIPALNRIQLGAYVQAQGNSANGQLAARYVGAVNTLKEEFANLAQGGYAPTEAVWALANRQIDQNYGVKQLGASLDEIQRLIRYRVQAIPGLSTVGPAADNRYTGGPPAPAPQGAQAPAPPPAAPGRTERPTITNPNTGEKMMLSPDGKSWVPFNSL